MRVVDTPGMRYAHLNPLSTHALLSCRSSEMDTEPCNFLAGLGDARGTKQDDDNIVKVGAYLDNNPVHCILLVCQAACPRVDNNTKGLLNILATKIAPKDYAKLGVIVNVYSHHDLARQQRSYNSKPRGQSEAEIQAGMKAEFADSLMGTSEQCQACLSKCSNYYFNPKPSFCHAGFAKDGKLALTEKHIATLVSHTFFVDSHYTPFTNPEDNHEAFVGLSLWARTCGEIDREGMTDDMAPVNMVSLMSAKPAAHSVCATPCG